MIMTLTFLRPYRLLTWLVKVSDPDPGLTPGTALRAFGSGINNVKIVITILAGPKGKVQMKLYVQKYLPP